MGQPCGSTGQGTQGTIRVRAPRDIPREIVLEPLSTFLRRNSYETEGKLPLCACELWWF